MSIPTRVAAGALSVAAALAPAHVPSASATDTPEGCHAIADAGGSNDVADADFYEGPSASRAYDREFARAFRIPHLPDYVPQGMTTWPNWNGRGESLLLIGLYRGEAAENEESRIAAVDPDTGRHLGSVRVRNAHLGGIGVAGEFLFAQDAARKGREDVRRYRLSSLREALEGRDDDFVGRVRDVQEIHGADFMTVHDGRLWAGRHSEYADDRMYEYDVDSAGRLTPTGVSAVVPPRTQGALVTDLAFVFNSTNHTRPGVLVIAERTGANRREVCFASPSMGEGLSLVGDWAFGVFEGGSYRYPTAVNRIRDVHVASMRELEGLLRRK